MVTDYRRRLGVGLAVVLFERRRRARSERNPVEFRWVTAICMPMRRRAAAAASA